MVPVVRSLELENLTDVTLVRLSRIVTLKVRILGIFFSIAWRPAGPGLVVSLTPMRATRNSPRLPVVLGGRPPGQPGPIDEPVFPCPAVVAFPDRTLLHFLSRYFPENRLLRARTLPLGCLLVDILTGFSESGGGKLSSVCRTFLREGKKKKHDKGEKRDRKSVV